MGQKKQDAAESSPVDTLHFVAENFEAVATRVESYRNDFGPHFDHWVVSVPSCSPHTIRVQGRASQGLHTSVWNATKGWLDLRSAADCDAVWDTQLALAISLVYSVPGVRQLSEREGRINELERMGCLDPDIADQMRAEGPPRCPLALGKLPPDRAELRVLVDSGSYELVKFIDDVGGLRQLYESLSGAALELSKMHGVPLFVDAGGLGKLPRDDLRRIYGIASEPLPKPRAERHCVMCDGSGYIGPAIGMSGMRQVCECRQP